MQNTNRVLIVGGGPVGLTLALNLAHYGIRSTVVERNATTTRHPKMDLTNGRSMELYRRLGLTELLRDAGVPRSNPFDISWVTNMAGHELYRFVYPSANAARQLIRAKNDGSRASEPGLRVSQIVIEPVLKRAADDHPLIDVRFDTSFERIVEQDDSGVVAEIVDNITGRIEELRCDFLAGCDGGGSRVRRQIGIELDGEMAVAGAYMVHFRTDAREVVQRWGIAWHYQNGAGTLIGQNDEDIYTLQAWLKPDEDIDSLTAPYVLERWIGQKFDYEILQANPWTANFVVAQNYRSGRVLLAGDSAHQFIPTGGYGMNSGIADAAGLSWVIAASIQGWGGDLLFDAYDRERRPTAWWHLEASRRHMGVRIAISGLYAAAGDVSGEGHEFEAKRAALASQVATLGNAENESWGVELGYRYDDSPVIWNEDDKPAIDPIAYRPSTWPGARLPHVFLEDGRPIHDKLGLYFTLVVVGAADVSAILDAAGSLGVPLSILQLGRPDLRAIYERDLILVRPDQHVAWRGDKLPDDVRSLLLRVVGRQAEAGTSVGGEP